MGLFTVEDNRRLTETGAGTPMGELFRRYWIPAFVSQRLPKPAGASVEIKLLGVPLIAQRDSSGLVSICTGETIYPIHEAGGIVWIYMGSAELQPKFPDFTFTLLPTSHVMSEMYLQESNWLQGLEGDLDGQHAAFLHGTLENGKIHDYSLSNQEMTIETVEAQACLETVAISPYTLDSNYIIREQHTTLLPCITTCRDNSSTGGLVHAWVPVDDEHHIVYFIHFDESAPLDDDERTKIAYGWGHDMVDQEDEFRSIARLSNKHLQNWKDTKNWSFSGITGVATQDLAVQAAMGPIVDRSLENLGWADTGIIKLRRFLLRTMVELEKTGKSPEYPVPISDVEGCAWIIPKDFKWSDVVAGRVPEARCDIRDRPMSETFLIAASARARQAIEEEVAAAH